MEGKRKLSPLNPLPPPPKKPSIILKTKDTVVSKGGKFGKLSSGHRTGKGQFSFQP